MNSDLYSTGVHYYYCFNYDKAMTIFQHLFNDNHITLDLLRYISNINYINENYNEAYKNMHHILTNYNNINDCVNMYYILLKLNNLHLYINYFQYLIKNNIMVTYIKNEVFNKIYHNNSDYINNIKLYANEINNNEDIYNFVYDILSDAKKEYRYYCYYKLSYYNSPIPSLLLNQNKEAVLIEFRKLPHLELLIRNAINKLGINWSYTIICGNLNHEYMINMCLKITNNIKVIKFNYDNLSVSDYNNLLSNKDFWNYLYGDKILIYQDDTFIFKNNIDDFISWDYIGAPWPEFKIGNGGFSLRTKQCMIDVINTKSNIDGYPEDLYFTETMNEYKIGKIADYNSAFQFSSEYTINNDVLGGHCFFLYNPYWKDLINNNI
jgi:hypothetical protein